MLLMPALTLIGYKLMASVIWMTSIGLSDGIELYTNPMVHQQCNCPYVMGMDWKDYHFIHAFMSGIKCCWFLIVPASMMMISFDLPVFCALIAFNILLPIILELPLINRLQKNNMYFCHYLLYLINGAYFIHHFISDRLFS